MTAVTGTLTGRARTAMWWSRSTRIRRAMPRPCWTPAGAPGCRWPRYGRRGVAD